jgi:thimet oligopeptidase
MLENWALDTQTLQHYARHDTTDAPMPQHLIDSLRAADTFGRAASARRQMYYAQISLQLHMRDPTVPGFDAAAVVRQLCDEYTRPRLTPSPLHSCPLPTVGWRMPCV